MLEFDLNGKTPDIAEENIQKLRTIFPDVFTENKVDFEKLQQVLGKHIETSNERYNFSWNGKAKALRIAQTPSTGTLRPCKEESKDWDTTQNLYIEGDNLEVLKLLQKSYHSKVKMIYIDPPYNTGNDFVYPDNFTDSIENYKAITGQVDAEGKSISSNRETNGRYHTDWLNMMYPRLRLARNLLTDDGVIFISIDDNEVDNLKKICNEIFGEDNFVGCLILQTATDNNPRQINTEHEYMLCYAKRKENLVYWQSISQNAQLINDKYHELKVVYADDIAIIQSELRKWIRVNQDKLEGVAHYDNVDEKGVFHDGDAANTVFGGYKYNVIHPVTGKPCKVPDKGFRFVETTMMEMVKNGNIMFGVDETTLIKPKKRIENAKDILRSIIYEDGRTSTKKFEQLMERDIFQNPKSDTIIQRLINFIVDEEGIVLDFFAGSATTAEAVFLNNVKCTKKIKFIMVQLPENMDKTNETVNAREKKTLRNAMNFLDTIQKSHLITEIGKERIRRAGEKINSQLNRENCPDVGFKVLKLDNSNIRKWQPDYENIEHSLTDFVDNYLEGRTELDVVYEIMLKYGLELTYSVDEFTIDSKKVYSIGFGMLVICLDNELTTEIARGILNLVKELAPKSTRVVFKDNGFKTDSNKTNIKEILKCGGIEEFITI